MRPASVLCALRFAPLTGPRSGRLIQGDGTAQLCRAIVEGDRDTVGLLAAHVDLGVCNEDGLLPLGLAATAAYSNNEHGASRRRTWHSGYYSSARVVLGCAMP